MKKMMKTWALVAAAAMGVAACQKEVQDDVQIKGETVTVKFVAQSPDTKTSVDTSGETPVFAWNETETFAVLEQTDALAAATSVSYEKVEGKANITAEFPANAGKGAYKYATVYPASAYVSATTLAEATLNLPAEQTMAEGSYDPNADLMVSEVVTATEQPTDAQMVRFTRLAAVVKMSLKGLGVELGDNVQSVTFTAEGKALAGTVKADLADPHSFSTDETVSSVTVATASADDVFFTVLPTMLEAGDAYVVTVITDKKLYIKQGTIPEGKTLEFQGGMVTRFTVNMTDVLPSDKWVLVRDASTLKEGDVVAVAAKNYNSVVGKQGNNYPTASKIEVIKVGDYLYHPIATSETPADEMIQHYTLLKRDNNRIAFDFYNAEDYDGDTSVGFVYATGSNYSPKLQAYCDVNTLFDVSIADGVATITATDIEKSYKYWRYSHSTTVTSRKFDCTSSEITNEANMLCLYRLEGAVGTVPVVPATVEVPDADEPVTIAEEGAESATPIDEVIFKYVGDWTISASASESWLSVSYADGVLSYTAEANTGAVREAVVTITAAREGSENLTWTFNVVQKGAPQEITIAEFMTKGKDENTTYKLTGRITEIPSSTSGTWKITDDSGNVAQIKYLKTDAGEYVKGNVDIKVGDVMTVTTVVTSTTKGSGGSSSYPSIYKGHYGLAVTMGVAADYTGGDVTITVVTSSNGAVTLPSAVEAVMDECDYATLSYDGGDTAVVSFPAENTTSDALEATVTFTYGQTSASVTVQQGVNPANKLGWELVTDASTLSVGDEVIIVAKNAAKALACPTKTSDTKFPSTDIEKTGNVIYDVEEAGVQTFVLDAGLTDGSMALMFTYKDQTYYPYYSSGLKMSTSKKETGSWTISIDETGNASISTVSSSKDYLIKFNSATSSLTFTAYLSTATNATKAENAVCIYKKQSK